MQESWIWNSTRLSGPARVARWGHFGAPVLLFPSAGGDFDEVQRFQLIEALRELIDSGRIKVYSVDGVAARAWLRGTHSAEHCARIQTLYDEYIDEEVVPLIRRDCQSDAIEIVSAGVAIGACSALAALCRKPAVFRVAIGLSGIYELSKYLTCGLAPPLEPLLPLYALRHLAEGPHAETLRRRFVLLASGTGEFESPTESQRMSEALSAAGIANNLELWGPTFAHCWNTWRQMLPRYLAAHA